MDDNVKNDPSIITLLEAFLVMNVMDKKTYNGGNSTIPL
jgi:hypothetical protein